MAEDSDLERTEQPSQRRLDQAREEGQVARSRELSTFTVLLAGGAGLWLMGGGLSTQLVKLLRDGLTLETDLAFHTDLLLPRLYAMSVETLAAFAPFMLLLFIVAMLSPMLINGWMFSGKALLPNFSKLNPIAGIGRIFSVHSMVELGKAIGKTLVVGGIGLWAIWQNREGVLALITQPSTVTIPELGTLMLLIFAFIMGGMLLIVTVDVPFQLWEHSKKLKMTKEEVRQESKETEGDPYIKSRIRSLQREMARRRMMEAIPTADVVVTNPTHYAVALRYKEGSMRAPVVVAKGSHLLAARIREIANEHNIPIFEAPPLARALHKHIDLGETIPEALYQAVAEVLAYVYQLHRYHTEGGAKPDMPQELPVPPQLDPDSQEST